MGILCAKFTHLLKFVFVNLKIMCWHLPSVVEPKAPDIYKGRQGEGVQTIWLILSVAMTLTKCCMTGSGPA